MLDVTIFNKILDAELFKTAFQPITGMRQCSILGVEALTRAVHPDTGDIIPPAELFDTARHEGTLLELERKCRKTALTTFSIVSEQQPDWLLFINFESAIIDANVVGSGLFLQQVEAAGLDPERIVIEVVESKVHEVDDLALFTQLHHGHGFLIALDDIGAGHSNLERIPRLKPDILKVDRSIVQEIDQHYHKQAVFESLANLAHKLGALVIAEGVETEGEALLSMDMGADLIQGYYLGRPAFPEDLSHGRVRDEAGRLAMAFRQHVLTQARREETTYESHAAISTSMISALSERSDDSLNRMLDTLVECYAGVECAYILDAAGTQVTDTIFHATNQIATRGIFIPGQPGTDHSLKEYVIMVRAGLRRYHTAPYISLASGQLCRTLAQRFLFNNREHILCIDFRIEQP